LPTTSTFYPVKKMTADGGTKSYYIPAHIANIIETLNRHDEYESKSDVVQTAVQELWQNDSVDKEISSYKRDLRRLEEDLEDLKDRREDIKDKIKAARERKQLRDELEQRRENTTEQRIQETIEDIARVIQEKGEDKAREAAKWRGVVQDNEITADELILRAYKHIDD